MKPSNKAYCSYGYTTESNWIRPLGFEITHNLEDADVVVFGGGKDVDPGFYNEKVGPRTDSPSSRDKEERLDFLRVQELRAEGKKVKTVGICRGGQLICALSNGKLIQDVSNHCGRHSIITINKEELLVNSIHHQMMYPYNLNENDYTVIATVAKNRSSHYTNGFSKPVWLPEDFLEPEIIHFKNTDALAIQFHPEMMFRSQEYEETNKWMQELFMKFYNNEL